MRFAAVRHLQAGLGVIPESALLIHQGRGWFRVSDWVTDQSLIHLSDYADASVDLDAVRESVAQPPSDAPEATVPAKTSKEK